MQSQDAERASDLTHIDLFAGVGGFGLALRRAGAKTVAAVEIDKYCRQVLARHFPEAALFNDIKEVTGDDLRSAGFVPERGVITGGVPCQDWSLAGRRAGIDGERSGLFWHYLRLLDELRPKWFVFENVPGLLSSNGGGDYGAVLGSLAELGYCVAGRIMDAQYWGVPQRRRRVFLVGHSGASWRAPAEVLLEPEGVHGDSAQGEQAQQVTASGAGVGAEDGGQPVAFHVTQDPISGDVSPCLRANSYIGVLDPVAALTANGVGTCGADDNQAQAGHLIAESLSNDFLRT